MRLFILFSLVFALAYDSVVEPPIVLPLLARCNRPGENSICGPGLECRKIRKYFFYNKWYCRSPKYATVNESCSPTPTKTIKTCEPGLECIKSRKLRFFTKYKCIQPRISVQGEGCDLTGKNPRNGFCKSGLKCSKIDNSEIGICEFEKISLKGETCSVRKRNPRDGICSSGLKCIATIKNSENGICMEVKNEGENCTVFNGETSDCRDGLDCIRTRLFSFSFTCRKEAEKQEICDIPDKESCGNDAECLQNLESSAEACKSDYLFNELPFVF